MSSAAETPAAGADAPAKSEPAHGWRLFTIWLVLALAADLLIWFFLYPHLPPGRMSDAAKHQQFDIAVLAISGAPVVIAVLLYFIYSIVVWRARPGDDGDGPPMSEEDMSKVAEKFMRSRPVVVDIAPSRVQGPSLDLAFEGQVTIDQSKPVGSITIKLRNFDATAKAVQGLGPDAEQKLTPVIVMAKGLGKPVGDGALEAGEAE